MLLEVNEVSSIYRKIIIFKISEPLRIVILFFSSVSDERSHQKLEKVGPFECDELEVCLIL